MSQHEADIDAVVGPGKRVHPKFGDVKEINFNFGKKVFSITADDGNMSDYDLEKITVIDFKRDGENFKIMIKKDEAKVNESSHESDKRAEPTFQPGQPSRDTKPQGHK